MDTSSSNIKLTPQGDVSDAIYKLFKSLRSRYQENLETSMKESDFIFDSLQLLFCKCHIKNFICGDSNINSPDQIKKKKSTINLKNTDDKCFPYAATAALNYAEIEPHPERV